MTSGCGTVYLKTGDEAENEGTRVISNPGATTLGADKMSARIGPAMTAKNLTLSSSVPLEKWRIKVTQYPSVSGVRVSDSDASGALKIYDLAPSEDLGGNVNWNFGGDLQIDATSVITAQGKGYQSGSAYPGSARLTGDSSQAIAHGGRPRRFADICTCYGSALRPRTIAGSTANYAKGGGGVREAEVFGRYGVPEGQGRQRVPDCRQR